jgi:H+/Cl- antiporter ClcA
MDQNEQPSKPRFGFYLVISLFVGVLGYFIYWGYANSGVKNEPFLMYLFRVVAPVVFVVAIIAFRFYVRVNRRHRSKRQ